MEYRKKILVIDSDELMRDYFYAVFSADNYEYMCAASGKKGCAVIEACCPDIVLMDTDLPDMNGNEIIKSVRKWSPVPIIVVSERKGEMDKVRALELGADDYITKPFGINELLARVRTAFRHTRTVSDNKEISVNGIFRTGGLVIDYNKYRVYVNGRDADLTQNEFRIVALLGMNAGKVLKYGYIIDKLWGSNIGKQDNRILRVNMTNIRRKLEKDPAAPQYIFTEKGVGYRMAESGMENK